MARFSVIVLMSASKTWRILQQGKGWIGPSAYFKVLNHLLYASKCVRVHHCSMSMLKTWFLPAMDSFHLFQKNIKNIKKCWKHHDIIVHSCWFYFNRNKLVAHNSFSSFEGQKCSGQKQIVHLYMNLCGTDLLSIGSYLCLSMCEFLWACKAHIVFCHAWLHELLLLGHSEPAPTTTAPWRMDGKWSGNNFLLGSSSLANHGGLAQLLFFFLLPTHNQVVSR
jgi:hypothetical protein